ncbi:hypothetical protein GCM10018966_073550 [Streptomyces yanii]
MRSVVAASTPAPGIGRVRRRPIPDRRRPRFCHGKPARYKIPRRLSLMDTFPATVNGKAVRLRVAVARELAAGR